MNNYLGDETEPPLRQTATTDKMGAGVKSNTHLEWKELFSEGGK